MTSADEEHKQTLEQQRAAEAVMQFPNPGVSVIALRDFALDLAKIIRMQANGRNEHNAVTKAIDAAVVAFHRHDIHDMIEPPGWLIERNDLGAPQWCMFGPRHGYTTYTTNANEALRFARKVDAEAFMRHHEQNDPALRVTEHAWMDARRDALQNTNPVQEPDNAVEDARGALGGQVRQDEV